MRRPTWLILVLTALVLATPAGAQQPPNRAGLVIQYDDGRVETACVRFREETISSLELLERAEVPVIAQGSAIGTAVCKIGGDGCDYPAEQCFCERDGPRAVYWAFYTGDGSTWTYAVRSAAGVDVRDGDLNGWAWGLGDSSGGAQPPLLTIDEICVEPPATALAPTNVPATGTSIAPTTISAAAATTAPPSPTPASPETEPSAQWPSYLGFAVLAAMLLIGGAVAARRRG
ncbi:MAG: hypothetical protein HC822_09300 [Oscillochloris sp.]|nr:hypothetical protein [Oscillochloris sp.]